MCFQSGLLNLANKNSARKRNYSKAVEGAIPLRRIDIEKEQLVLVPGENIDCLKRILWGDDFHDEDKVGSDNSPPNDDNSDSLTSDDSVYFNCEIGLQMIGNPGSDILVFQKPRILCHLHLQTHFKEYSSNTHK